MSFASFREQIFIENIDGIFWLISSYLENIAFFVLDQMQSERSHVS